LADPFGRLQNALLLASAAVLAVTGLPQRFDPGGAGSAIADAMGGIEVLRTVHHAAGAVLAVIAVYHVVLVFASLAQGDMRPLSMVPVSGDRRDAFANARYLTGIGARPPTMRRPTYFQKLDYWVVVWLVGAMVVTGLIRLFPVKATQFLSGNLVAAALDLHSSIALLVAVWILLVHGIYAANLPPPEAEMTAEYTREEDVSVGGL
jgi:thiosulfate reductase cytochrome b subunit